MNNNLANRVPKDSFDSEILKLAWKLVKYGTLILLAVSIITAIFQDNEVLKTLFALCTFMYPTLIGSILGYFYAKFR